MRGWTTILRPDVCWQHVLYLACLLLVLLCFCWFHSRFVLKQTTSPCWQWSFFMKYSHDFSAATASCVASMLKKGWWDLHHPLQSCARNFQPSVSSLAGGLSENSKPPIAGLWNRLFSSVDCPKLYVWWSPCVFLTDIISYDFSVVTFNFNDFLVSKVLDPKYKFNLGVTDICLQKITWSWWWN